MQTRVVNVSGGVRIKRQLSFMSGGALRLLFLASLVDAVNKTKHFALYLVAFYLDEVCFGFLL